MTLYDAVDTLASALAAAEKQNACRLLLIDDNPHGLAARKSLLADRGYAVTTAQSGEEGVRCFESTFAGEPFDLVVTDYRMPGIQGEDVARLVKAADPNLPVIILSGYAVVLALTPESTGADIVLAKGPREQHELVQAVESLLPLSLLPQSKKPAFERKSATGFPYSGRRRRTGSA